MQRNENCYENGQRGKEGKMLPAVAEIQAVHGLIFEELLEALKQFIQDDLKDYNIPVKQEGWEGQPLERPVEVSKMILREVDEDRERVPYIMLQLLNGIDDLDENGQMISRVNIRACITVFNRDKEEGRMEVLHIIQRLRRDLIRAGVIGNSFEVLWPMEYLIYPEDMEWHHLGEISIMFSVPPVERDVSFLHGLKWD